LHFKSCQHTSFVFSLNCKIQSSTLLNCAPYSCLPHLLTSRRILKAASTHRLVSYCTAKRNLLRYCTAPPIPAYLIYLRPKEYLLTSQRIQRILHDTAFPVCQVSLLVEYGSLVFAFQKLPAHIVCFLTELQNTFFYAIALRPLFLLIGNHERTLRTAEGELVGITPAAATFLAERLFTGGSVSGIRLLVQDGTPL